MTLPPLPKKPFNPTPVWVALVAALFYVVAVELDVGFAELAWGARDMVEFMSRFSSPDFSDLGRYARLMGETLAIGLWGTALAVVIGMLAAPFAARNLSPSPVVYRVTREVLNLVRAMPDLLLALIFVAAIGLGPLPGVLALGLHTGAFLGKFYAECLERVDRGTYEAVRASGANFLQVTVWAGWPSILQELVSYAIYVLDRNVRMAVVLGLVGAGGVGIALTTTLRLFEYNRASALILVVLATILAIDYLSAWLRAKVR